MGLGSQSCAFGAMLLFSSLTSATPVGETPTSSNSFSYTWMNDGMATTIDESNRRFLLSGDYRGDETAVFCAVASGYFCVHANGMDFAVPRELNSGQNSWSEGGRLYQVIKSQTGSRFFARYVQYMIIKGAATQHDPVTYYFYSPHDGLLGWESHIDPTAEPELVLLSGDVGFARQGS